jgi:nitroimidazol reductase NimA-like FMN-containing flavoprotein (pyridoxamine 5'-phosphate oxidase superfamily)
MTYTMTREDRERFLAEPHVGVLGLADGERGPLTVPIWYAYEPGGDVRFVTGRTSRKGRLLQTARRLSLCAQTTEPYRYVSIEGPIVSLEAADVERDLRPMARRYMGPEEGDAYLAATRDEHGDDVIVRIRPERWLSADFDKADGG